jgi:phosphate/phosphite/phosphonate ABC transporter binding protein
MARRMSQAPRWALVCAALLPLVGPAAVAAGEVPAPVRIAVAPMISPEETVAAYRDLMDYLAAKLGRPVQMKQRRTYQEVNDLLGTGQLEAGILCSGTYVHARRQYGAELLAVPVVNGSPTYRSYIIVRNDIGAGSFEELRGRRFAFTDPLSTSGYLYPVYTLLAMALNPRDFFAKTLFTYSHDNSIEAVAEGVVDGAAVDGLIYDYLQSNHPERVARTRVVHRSPSFGIPPVAVPRTVSPDLKRQLREAFLGLDGDPRGREILARLGVDRFLPGDERLYDEVSRMLRVVERGMRR